MALTIVAIGPDSPDLLTLGAAQALREASAVLLRTGRHGVAAWLKENSIAFETLDALYESAEDFDALARAAAEAVMRFSQRVPGGVYAVPDPTNDETVAELLRRGVEIKALCGVTQGGCAAVQALCCGTVVEEGALCIPAAALRVQEINPARALILTEIDSRLRAGEAKLKLLEIYPPQFCVVLGGKVIALCDLDRQKRYDHLSCAYLPPCPLKERSRFTFNDLLDIMVRLRRRGDGCPWDLQQTHESLRQYLIEEAHEAVAAINGGDPERMADELGDVLLQVVFHAQVAAEHATFTITDITSAICAKMISRHRHIFGENQCATAEEVLNSWEQIKKEEKGLKSTADVMRDVPQGLPALMRASKVQNKAHQVGFDWAAPLQALEKVTEETDEVRAELAAGRDPQEEFGDLLFAAAHAARLSGVQPELALDQATEKFIRRFAAMEKAAQSAGATLSAMTLAQMETLWEQAKRTEREGTQK